MSAERDSWAATAAISGLACVALYAVGAVTVLGLPGTEASGAEVARYAEAHRTLLLAGSYAWGVGVCAQLIFAAAFWGVLRGEAAEASSANLAGLAGAVALSVLTFAGFATLVTLAFRPGGDANARLFADLFAIMLAYAGFPAALWGAATSLAIIRARRYRPWIAWLGFAAAVVHLLVAGSFARSGFFSPSGLPGLMAPVLIVAWIAAVACAAGASCDVRIPGFVRSLTLARRASVATPAPRDG